MFRETVKFIFTLIDKVFFRIEYIHPEKFPREGPAIIVSNHQHTFDIPAIHCAMKPWVYWVSKKELTDQPVLGPLILKMGVMPVDRHHSDMSVARSMFGNIRRGHVIGIFPQGTRARTPDMIETIIPKTGAVHFALRTGVPVIPVGIRGPFRLFGRVRVTVGDPIDLKALAERYPPEDRLYELTIHVMKTIYALADYDYKMTADVYRSERHDP